VILHVYRLRQSGNRVDRLTLRHRPGLLGEFVYERGPHEFWGKRPMFAKLLEPGTARELIPHLEQARIVRVRRGLLVVGVEVIVRAAKGKGQHYRQSWVCTSQPIADGDWPPPPRDPIAQGFDPADDDAE
jgi:hypothetical protein